MSFEKILKECASCSVETSIMERLKFRKHCGSEPFETFAWFENCLNPCNGFKYILIIKDTWIRQLLLLET